MLFEIGDVRLLIREAPARFDDQTIRDCKMTIPSVLDQ
jgi:hypothetical protein